MENVFAGLVTNLIIILDNVSVPVIIMQTELVA